MKIHLIYKKNLLFLIVYIFIIMLLSTKIPNYLNFAEKFFQNFSGYNGEITISEGEYLKYLYDLNLRSISKYNLVLNKLKNKQYWDLEFVNSTFIVSDPYTMLISNRLALSNTMLPQVGFVFENHYNNETLQLWNNLRDAIKSTDYAKIELLVKNYLLNNGLENHTSNIYLVISTRTGIWLNTKVYFVSINKFRYYSISNVNSTIRYVIERLSNYFPIEAYFNERSGYDVTVLNVRKNQR